MKKVMVAFVGAALLLSGCAKNYVESFQPIVDTKGVDLNRYQVDLRECRDYAVQEDPANKAARQAIAGALVGAALGAAVGSAYGQAGYGAGVGAGYGAVGGAAHGALTGMQAQQLIVSRCLSGRGYNVLYGGDLAK